MRRAHRPSRGPVLAALVLVLAGGAPAFAQDTPVDPVAPASEVPLRRGGPGEGLAPRALLDPATGSLLPVGEGDEGGTESLGLDMGTGAFQWDVLEIWQPGLADLDLRIERVHLSGAGYDGPLGWNWDSPLFMRIADTGSNTAATLYDGRFNVGSFAFAGGGGVARYTTPDGFFLTLIRTGSGTAAVYSATAPQGEVYRFEYDVQQGGKTWYRLKDVTDTHGNRLAFSYAANTLLQSVTDTVGNVTSFTWILAGANAGRLQSLAAAGGATLGFEYDPAGRLVKVKRPAPDGAPGTADELLAYDAASRLVSITNPGDAAPWLVNTYDAQGRVVAQQQGAAGQMSTLNWSAFPAVTHTDRLGQVTDYVIDPASKLVKQISVRDMSQPGVAWTTQLVYDAHRHLVREIKPDGQTYEWTWEASADARRRNNLLRFEHKASPAASPGLRRTWAYTTLNRPAWEMTPRANAATGGVFDATRATLFTYDATGNMTAMALPPVATPSGPQLAQLAWKWDARGRVTSFTNPRGLQTDLVYDDSQGLRPFPTKVVADPAGAAVVETYAYDSVNLLVSANNPCACGSGSAQVDYAYDASRRLRQANVHVDASTVRQTVYDHDAQGRTTAERAQDDSPVGDGWAVTSWSYDLLGHPVSSAADIDATRAAVSGWTFDPEERLLEASSPAGRAVRYQHDERDLVTEVRMLGDAANPADDVVTSLQHDTGGRISREDRPDGTFEIYAYDAWGRLVSVTDNLGRVTSYTWDENGNMLSEELRAPGGALLDRYAFTWDERDRLARVESLAVDASGAPLGGGDGLLTLSVERDAGGNVTAMHRENGATVTRTWDLFDRLLTERDGQTPASGMDIEYHANGLPRRLFVVEGDPATGLSPRRLETEWISYDLEHRPLEVRDGAGLASFRTWSLGGQLRRYVDQRGSLAEMTYDEAGRMLSHRRPLNPASYPAPGDLVCEYVHDDDDLLVAAIARNQPNGPDQATLLQRDAFGQLDIVQWNDGSSDDYDYDTALRPVRHRDARGNVATYTYDAAGRLADTAIARAPGVGGTTAEHLEYDLRDRATLVRNDDFDVLRTFDSLGAAESETIVDRILGYSRTSRAGYDASGRLVRLEYPSHTATSPDVLNLAWDGADRLTGLSKSEPAGTRTVAQFQWMGERLLRRWNGALDTHATWDAQGRPQSIEHKLASGNSLARFDMRYGPTGEVTGVLRTFFDPAGQPLPAGASGGLGGGLDNVYDAAYRLVASRGGISATDWLALQVGSALLQTLTSFDRNENRATVSESTDGVTWSLTGYVAGLVNQYLAVVGQAASYDSAGNLLAMPAGPTALSYDYLNRPIGWSAGGQANSARYDGLGRRIGTGNAQRAEFMTYFDSYALEQIVAGPLPAPVREFVYGDGLDEVLEVRDAIGGAAYPMATDNLGSPVALLTSGGAVVESYRYSVFGRRFAASPVTGAIQPGSSSVVGIPVAFGGRWSMNGSDEMLDFRARTYLPDWGRFAQPDPLGYPNGRLNRYQLSGNDPFSKDNWGLHDPGKPTDPPGVNTHVGITKQAGDDVKFDVADRDLAAFWNWNQDNAPNVAAIPGNGGKLWNNFHYHALGRTQEKQEARLRELMDAATGATTGECSMQSLGEALHYAQDMVAHRRLDGSIYGERFGHAGDTMFGFDPDGPEDATGNEEVERYENYGDPGFGPPLWVKVKVQRNPHGYERHLRKLRAIKNSADLMKEFMKKCGPGVGQAHWPRYQGGKPKPPETGGKTGPTTPRGGKTEGPKGPTTPGGGEGSTKPPSTGGPITPGGGGPTTPRPGPITPGGGRRGPITPRGGPTTPGPSGPTTPVGPSTGDPRGPVTPGSGGGCGPGPVTGPKKPAGKQPGEFGGGG